MVSFWVYDVGFLILFSVWVAWFLRSRKKSLSREGIIFMYRTQLGVKAIKYIGDNFKKMLHALKYVIITVGLALMGTMIWMLWTTLSIYILHPEITKVIKAPPIAPLIPYFPKLFGMQSFFPPFYFTYFILALAIVAIVHEFSHGIFMRLFKIKIKSTGLVFLGPILGAFVEEDRKDFEKKTKIEQMSVLGAGVFANVFFALIFYGLYVAFFFISFSASGYAFNAYADVAIPTANITGMEIQGNLTRIMTTSGKDFYANTAMLEQINLSSYELIPVYYDAPAVKIRMEGAIVQMNDAKIREQEDIVTFMQNTEPGDMVKVITEDEGEQIEYNIVLGEHPLGNGLGYLGIGYGQVAPKGFIQNALIFFMSFKDRSTYYAPTWDGEFVYFFYHLLWWIMIINLLVAIFNMLPLGMLDGGRFFYLTIWGITRSEKVGKIASKVMKYFILAVFVLLMYFWFIRII
ncbi:MAG: site-2 protease family protein [Nanoarchaeota archaeon]|nr:site-2 protease family protein [Nanoarchaeota archaeon]